MKPPLLLAFIIVSEMWAAVPAVNGQTQTAGDKRFCALDARNLVGDKIRIPQDLNADKSCIIVAFERQQQSVIDSWIPSLLKLEKEKNGFAFYEVPVIQSG